MYNTIHSKCIQKFSYPMRSSFARGRKNYGRGICELICYGLGGTDERFFLAGEDGVWVDGAGV